MTEIETRDESQALQIASDALDRHLDSYDREVFRAGWLAGRDWARQQAADASAADEGREAFGAAPDRAPKIAEEAMTRIRA